MGFHFRKSLKFGLFRLNFSKSGVGVSAGMKGARVSVNAHGAYINVGANGVYYRKKISSTGTRNSGKRETSASPSNDFMRSQTTDVSKLVDTSDAELLREMNSRIQSPRNAFWQLILLIVITVCLAFLADSAPNSVVLMGHLTTVQILFGIVFLVFALGMLRIRVLHRREQAKRVTHLNYKLSDEYKQEFGRVYKSIASLAGTNRIWSVGLITPTWDWKRNAGASSLVTRTPVQIGILTPPFIETNFRVYGLKLARMQILFFPDQMIIFQNGRYGAIAYERAELEWATTTFVEDGTVPSDSRFVKHTWRYVRKDGGPDMRFTNNRQLPVLEYGQFRISSQTTGLDLQLMVSSSSKAGEFVRAYEEYRRLYSKKFHEAASARSTKQTQHETQPNSKRTDDPYHILGVSPDASWDEVTKAYRRLAQMYHPDKVAGLAPEFQALANTKMTQINHAYEQLRSVFKK